MPFDEYLTSTKFARRRVSLGRAVSGTSLPCRAPLDMPDWQFALGLPRCRCISVHSRSEHPSGRQQHQRLAAALYSNVTHGLDLVHQHAKAIDESKVERTEVASE